MCTIYNLGSVANISSLWSSSSLPHICTDNRIGQKKSSNSPTTTTTATTTPQKNNDNKELQPQHHINNLTTSNPTKARFTKHDSLILLWRSIERTELCQGGPTVDRLNSCKPLIAFSVYGSFQNKYILYIVISF